MLVLAAHLQRVPRVDIPLISPSGWYHQVENLTACISINHNWCNSINLPSLYDAMCVKVTEVEHALEDVQELLSQDNTEGPDDVSSGWKREWIAIVQDVVEKDAGWKWVSCLQSAHIVVLTIYISWLTFWKMIRHALRLATGCPCPMNESLWPRTSLELMPQLDFITTRIRSCYDNFMTRDRLETVHVLGLEDILLEIRSLLNTSCAN